MPASMRDVSRTSPTRSASRAVSSPISARNDARYLRRNALVALGNTGEPEDIAVAEGFLDEEDDLLREQAAWTVTRIQERYAD